jgi:glycosyltransferase involved in cell wall biosynthesis
MKKVVIIAYDFNPNIGSEAGAAYIWSEIIKKHYEIVIYTQKKHKEDLEKHGCTSTIRFINSTPIVSKCLFKLRLYNIDFFLFLRKLKKRLSKDINNGFELIHFNTPAGIHSYTNLGQKLKVPYIVGPIGGFLKLPPGFPEYRNFNTILKDLFYTRLLKKYKWKNYFENAEEIICGTELVKKHLPDVAKKKCRIIFDTFVDTEFFDNKGVFNNSTKVTIIFTGRLALFKGCILLLKSFENLLHKGYKNIELIFAGDGEEEKNIRDYISKNNLGSFIKMPGKVNRNTLRNYLLNSDIYCLPTLKDNGGTAILEAMACSLPVISTNYGGPAYSIVKGCGILIEPTNIESYIKDLTKALESLINDRELRINMGNNARNHVVSNYSQTSLQEKALNVYNDVFKRI